MVLTCLPYGIHRISYILSTVVKNGRILKLASYLLLLHMDTKFFTRNECTTLPVPRAQVPSLNVFPSTEGFRCVTCFVVKR